MTIATRIIHSILGWDEREQKEERMEETCLPCETIDLAEYERLVHVLPGDDIARHVRHIIDNRRHFPNEEARQRFIEKVEAMRKFQEDNF